LYNEPKGRKVQVNEVLPKTLERPELLAKYDRNVFFFLGAVFITNLLSDIGA
jgi:hypothetical protein